MSFAFPHMELKVFTKIVVKVDTLETLKLTVIGSILLISVGMAVVISHYNDKTRKYIYSPTTKTDQDGTVENLAVMGRLRQQQDYN
jgi:hypothetical protein